MPTHRHTHTVSDGLDTFTSTVEKTAEGQTRLDVVVATNATNVGIDFAVDMERMKSLYIVATAAMTLKTNSSSSPAQTINLPANTPVEWYDGSGFTNPITADITSLFVTSVPGGTLRLRVLNDPTP